MLNSRSVRDCISVLAEFMSDGYTSGWQIAIRDASTLVEESSGSDGLGRLILPDTRFNVYCAIKPVLAAIVGVLVDRGELSFDDRLGDLLDCDPSLENVTIASLMEHRSGVFRPTAVETAVKGGDERLRVALQTPLDHPALGPDDSRYTEAAAWILLGAAALSSVGAPDLRAVAVSTVLEPLGLDDEFDLADEPDSSRHGVNVSVRPGKWWPLLIERTDALDWSTNPGYGGRATSRGLLELTREVVRCSRGDGQLLAPATASELIRRRPARVDKHFARQCSFGRGWLTDLGHHGFDSIPSTAVGSVGLTGMTACWSIPEPDFSVAYHFCGLSDPEITTERLRHLIVKALV